MYALLNEGTASKHLWQILFLFGIPLVIGPRYTYNFFFQKSRWKGTALFFLGILMVLFKWTFLGFFVELFGFINLFGCVLSSSIFLEFNVGSATLSRLRSTLLPCYLLLVQYCDFLL